MRHNWHGCHVPDATCAAVPPVDGYHLHRTSSILYLLLHTAKTVVCIVLRHRAYEYSILIVHTIDWYAIISTASVEKCGTLLVLTVLFALKKLQLPVVPLSSIPLPSHSRPRTTPGGMLASQDKMRVVVGL